MRSGRLWPAFTPRAGRLLLRRTLQPLEPCACFRSAMVLQRFTEIERSTQVGARIYQALGTSFAAGDTMKAFHQIEQWAIPKTSMARGIITTAALLMAVGCSDPYARSQRPSHPAAPSSPAPGCKQYKPVCVGSEEHCEFDRRGCEVCTCNATEGNPGPWQQPETPPH